MSYLDKLLIINLSNGFYFRGKCINESETTLTIIDQKNHKVVLQKSGILSLEVSNG